MTKQEQKSPAKKDENYQAWKIVIIEDDEGLGKLIQVNLQRQGFSTLLAETGEDALAKVQGESDEILLVDYKLPDMTGKELVQKLTKKFNATPHFITLTGYGNEHIAAEMMKLGSHDYIVKEKKFVPLLTEVVKHTCEHISSKHKLSEVYAQLEKNLELLKTTEKLAKIGSWEFDPITQKQNWSDEIFRILEMDTTSGAPVVPKGLGFIDSKFRPAAEKAIKKAIQKGEPYDHEWIVTTTKGKKRWVNAIANPVVKNGKVVKVTGSFQDITKRKEAEENLKAANQQLAASEQQLRASNQQLAASEQQLRATNQQLKAHENELIAAKEKAEESDRLKSAFLTNMSHEIRTPMNGILGFTSLLQNPNLTGEKQQQYIEIIQNSGKRMLNTMNDLIEISSLETGQINVKLEPVDICHEIKLLCDEFQRDAEQKGLTLIHEKCLPDNHSEIITDKTKLISIVNNLLQNALKYTDKGSIIIGCDKGEGYFSCFVKDTGIGIPRNRQQAIFNRFEQADIEDTRAFEGSGLGLAISKAYIEMLDGKIWVESKEGAGSTFYIQIPLNANEPEKPKSEKVKPEIRHEQSRIKPKILIAEDDETSLYHLSYVLTNHAREIIHARNGKQAVELCKQHPDIDLILLDIKMPVLNGYDAARLIRDFNKKTAIIAQTAYALSGDREKALAAGCNDYISKPINNKLLLEKIEKLNFN